MAAADRLSTCDSPKKKEDDDDEEGRKREKLHQKEKNFLSCQKSHSIAASERVWQVYETKGNVCKAEACDGYAVVYAII